MKQPRLFVYVCVCHYFYTEHCIMYNRGHHALHFLFTISSSEFTWIVLIVSNIQNSDNEYLQEGTT